MSRSQICGFSGGDTLAGGIVGGTLSLQSSVKRNGTYALRVNPTTTGTGNFSIQSWNATTGAPGNLNVATVYVRFYFRYGTKPSSGSEEIFRTAGSGNTKKISIRLTSAGNLAVYDTAESLSATGSTTLNQDQWYRIEIMAGTGSNANYEVKINGATEVSGTCNQLTNNVARCVFGKKVNLNSQSVDFYYDDIAVDTSEFPGPGTITEMMPISAGTFSSWSGSYTDVDDLPHDSDTTYISTSTSGVSHSVRFPTCDVAGIPSGADIKAVTGIAIVRDEGGTSSLSQFLRLNGNNLGHTTAQDLTTTYVSRGTCQTTGLTRDIVDNMEVGVTSSAAVAVRCTQMRAEVEYENPTIFIDESTVSVATSEGGVPEQNVSIFSGAIVGNGTGSNVIATVVISDATKATFLSIPSGWNESPTGTFSCSARTASQLTSDLQSLEITVNSIGTITATLTVTLSDGTDYVSEVITINVVAPDLSASYEDGSVFDFEEIQANTPTTHQFTIYNVGLADLVIGTITTTGGFSIDSGDDPSSTTVNAGFSTTVSVECDFSSNGLKTGSLTIPSNDPSSPYVINLLATVVGGDFDEIQETGSGGVTVTGISNVDLEIIRGGVPYPTIEFRVNLNFSGIIGPASSPYSQFDLGNQVIGIPGVGRFRHNDTFELFGNEALYVLNNYKKIGRSRNDPLDTLEVIKFR